MPHTSGLSVVVLVLLFPESIRRPHRLRPTLPLPWHITTNYSTANASDVLPAGLALIPYGTDGRDIGY